MSQQALAQMTGVGARTIGRIERGESKTDDSINYTVLEDFLGISTQPPAIGESLTDEEAMVRKIGDRVLWAEVTRRYFQRAEPDADADRPKRGYAVELPADPLGGPQSGDRRESDL